MDMFVSKGAHAEHTHSFAVDSTGDTATSTSSTRRLRTLRELALCTGNAHTGAKICQNALDVLSDNPTDLPCTLLYLLQSDQANAWLMGSSGLAEELQPAFQQLSLQEDTDNQAFAPFIQIFQTGTPLVVEKRDLQATADASWFSGTAWPDKTLLLPLVGSERPPVGLLIVGLNPLLALDEEYRGFLELVALQITGALNHVRELEAERQSMNAFLGLASHELKNPLTSMRGNVSLAIRRVSKARQEFSGQDTKQQELFDLLSLLLERAERQILMQSRLVNDLVDSTRMQSGKLELHPELIDVNTIVRKAVEEQHQFTPTRELHVELPDDGTYLVMVDAERIKQVIANYLSNALKFSEKDQAVTIAVEATEQAVRVSVRDAGPGLPMEEQERVWERFYHAPGVEIRSGGGSGLGLGLFICRTIIEKHQGCVGVASTPEQGSTFWFTVPWEGPVSDG